jgi:ferredoxin
MQLDSVKLIYFSPTGSTRRVLRSIAAGIQAAQVDEIDLTPPDAASRTYAELGNELTVIGMPVYAGRLPKEAAARLRRLRGNGTLAVLVVVYGNRKFDDALVEMQDLVEETGFLSVAGAAFIGEHSYTSEEKPLSVGRPDTDDLAKAAKFGENVRAKLEHISSLEGLSPLVVPGNRPYKELKNFSDIVPETDDMLCTLCEECMKACPTAAITINDYVETDAEKCIVCCACVKVCPTEARVMRNERILKTADWLYENYSEPKDPEVFL